jgi:hypothetical protein
MVVRSNCLKSYLVVGNGNHVTYLDGLLQHALDDLVQPADGYLKDFLQRYQYLWKLIYCWF